MKTLFTPWRYAYISKPKDPAAGCFLCAAGREPDDPERLVVHTTDHHLVILNRHPYTNGHVMVAPRAHLASPREEAEAARHELWEVVLDCQRVLEAEYRPDGFNLGMNLGRAAGAGVPDHYHFHVVPRWSADTNFIGVVAGARLVPEALYDTWEKLRRRFAQRED